MADESESEDAETCYADDDEDGYGDPDDSQDACSEPPGYVDDASDCDDADIDVNPGADEVCNDEIDNDCDGAAGACTMDLQNSDLVFLGGAANDQGGRTIANMGDWNADGVDDLLIGSRAAGGTAGVGYVYYGATTIADWGQATMDSYAAGGADVTFTGANAGDYAAVSSAGGYDMSGGGSVDFALGSASPDSERGAVWMVFGDDGTKTSGDLSLADADASWAGSGAYDRAAGPDGLAFVGDIDSDGYNDMLVGANSADPNGTSSGIAYLVYGPITAGDYELSDVDDYIYGETDNNRFGKFVSRAGDTDGDGLDEIMVGTLYANSNTGAVYLFDTAPTGAFSAADADAILDGEGLSDYAGYAIAPAGDQNGDSYEDILVSSTGDDQGASDGGAAYLVLGPVTSGDLAIASTAKIYGTVSGGGLGSSVAGHADVDGSGTPALMVGATGEHSSAGSAYVFYGLVTGTVSTSSADGQFTGTYASDAAGQLVKFSDDLDGSGLPWLIVGTYQADEGGTDAGAAYLIEGLGL